MERTPILITTYNRSENLDKLLSCIQRCDHSSEYSFFIHIDGVNIYKPGDIIEQKQIEEVLSKYQETLNIVEIKKEKNHLGLANSIINSVSSIINKCGSIIVIEDDLLLSPDALDFVDDALKFYHDDMNIWSVTAWTPKLNRRKTYDQDVHFQFRGSSWCWGTWKNRWNEVDWNVDDYEKFRNDYNAQMFFCRGGYDLPGMLRQQMMGNIDSWAVRWVYSQNKRNMLTVYPIENRVQNIGIGAGKGTHTKRYIEQEEILKETHGYEFTKEINFELVNEYKKIWGIGFKEWITNYYRKQSLECDRLEGMFNIMETWKTLNESGYSIDKYFAKRNFKRIAIYGNGRIGRHLEHELRTSIVDPVYFIDQNSAICDGVKCLSLDSKWPKVDCVVITVTTDIANIRKRLEKEFVVKTMMEVLKDI